MCASQAGTHTPTQSFTAITTWLTSHQRLHSRDRSSSSVMWSCGGSENHSKTLLQSSRDGHKHHFYPGHTHIAHAWCSVTLEWILIFNRIVPLAVGQSTWESCVGHLTKYCVYREVRKYIKDIVNQNNEIHKHKRKHKLKKDKIKKVI